MIKKTFEVDPKTVEIKKLLGKDFLELSMRTVSSANPNRNGSYFTKEAQEKALESYNNKPILAYFENGDFVSHDGQWTRDTETGMDFWDTIGVKGERPIGVIREKDHKEVVYDESDGLYWTEITCALWTQYSYRQVKRLIEDAQKAALEGGQAKSISVEVDILDYEVVDGVEVIKDYALTGVTILGSRRGKKVEPGIEGAGLSVLDVISKDLYEKQRHSILRAYERLDDALAKKEENMDPEKKEKEEGELCPECGKNPCECENKPEQEEIEKEEPKPEQNEDKPEEKPEEGEPEEGEPKAEKNSLEGEIEKEEPKKEDIIRDLAWMIEGLGYKIEDYDRCIDHYEEAGDELPGKKLVIATLKRMKECAKEEIAELGKLLALVSAEDFVEDPEQEEFECKLSEHCCISKLYSDYLSVEKECNEMKEKCAALEKECEEHKNCLEEKEAECKLSKEECEKIQKECDELKFSAFMEKATSAIEEAKDSIGEEVAKNLFERCEKKDIFSLEVLNDEIALAVGKAALANKSAKTAYSAPVPTFPSAIQGKTAEVKSKDPFERMGYKSRKK